MPLASLLRAYEPLGDSIEDLQSVPQMPSIAFQRFSVTDKRCEGIQATLWISLLPAQVASPLSGLPQIRILPRDETGKSRRRKPGPERERNIPEPQDMIVIRGM